MKGENMKKEIGLIIKMPTEQASPEEIEERKSKVSKLLKKWTMEAFIKEKGMEDMFKGVELEELSMEKFFDKLLKYHFK